MTPPPIGCSGCPARWGGTKTAHCSGCHQTFTAMGAFDKHRVGDHAAGTRTCANPASVGLVRTSSRGYPCWASPGDDSEWWQ